MTMRRMAMLFVAYLVLGTGPLLAQDQIGLARGATATGVVIEDLEGDPVDLGTIVGTRPVLLQFWATWCPDCERLFPHLAAMHERYG